MAAIVGPVSWRLTRPPGPTTSLVSSTPVQRGLTRLTFDEGLQTHPAFSPDGRLIAYASDKSGNFDIWVQQLSGGEAVQVTKSAATDTQPAWSPDGSTIAFRSERDGGGIYVVPALGGAEVKLTALGEHPSWSPDGSEVWFIMQTFTHASSVVRAVPLDGGAIREILPGSPAQATGSGSRVTRTDGCLFSGFDLVSLASSPCHPVVTCVRQISEYPTSAEEQPRQRDLQQDAFPMGPTRHHAAARSSIRGGRLELVAGPSGPRDIGVDTRGAVDHRCWR